MDKIICLGKNYLEHAKELGDVVPEKPVLFLKPPSSAVWASQTHEVVKVQLPRNRGSVHHECEIVLLIGRNGSIQSVTLGLDLTLRDLQTELKKKGHPWEISKVFKDSAVIGPWLNRDDFPSFLEEEFSFVLEGKVRQKGKATEMTLAPDLCIAHAREYFDLREGDVVFTGTPAGVGPVLPGQKGELHWAGKCLYRVQFL